MVRVRAQESWAIRDVCRLTGFSKVKVWEDIRAGRLRATKGAATGRYSTSRNCLIDYLFALRFPLSAVRNRLYPEAVVVSLGLGAGSAAAAGFLHEPAGGLFDLGKRLATVPVWAVVVRLENETREDALDGMAGYAAERDRPHLVCIDTGGHAIRRTAPALAVFDIAIPPLADEPYINRTLHRLRAEGSREGRRG